MLRRCSIVAVLALSACGSRDLPPAAQALVDGQLIVQRVCRSGGDASARTEARQKLERARQIATGDDALRMQAELSLAELEIITGDVAAARSRLNGVLRDVRGASLGRFGAADVTHSAHTLLGRAALKEGDVARATAELDASTRISASPNLQNVGPSFDLAQALVDAGEKEAVLRYLSWAETYWALVTSYGMPTRWKDQLKRGARPEMSKNHC